MLRISSRLFPQMVATMLVASLLWTPFFYAGSIAFASTKQNSLTLKWKANLLETHLAPLAADLNGDGKMEVVIAGVAKSGNGTLMALDGATGSVVWNTTDDKIGTHSPFDIVDLNKDGIPEIVVSAWFPKVYYGNNGSLYWTNTACRAFQDYNAICDINGDGYPEIFVSSGSGPSIGYDYITCLSYDGHILYQSYSWHPCFGGLTIGDTNHDGRYELYQGDRGIYSDEELPFVGGGMGVRALDPFTLQPLWNDPTVALSSSCPILADVDKDGTLDVIVADQRINGTAVYNSKDGTVLTTGGKYRKSGTDMPGHSQPTVCDVDNDGNLELINCRERNGVILPVKIWDLYDWKLDAILPVNCTEPPKVGDVTGDGNMDIIAVRDNGNSSEIFVYSFNNSTGNYDQVDHVSGLRWKANDFTLVQDLDADGYNELVVTSMNGDVYCYDTPAPTPQPNPRSEIQFYGENKCGVAEYVPSPTPSGPVVIQEQPPDGSLGQPFNPVLSVNSIDYQQHKIDIAFGTNSSGTWKNLGSYTGASNGKYRANSTGMDKPGTTYCWSINVTDVETGMNTYQTFSFTTRSNSPTQSDPNFSPNSNTASSLTCTNQSTSDVDGDKVTNIYNWYVNDTSLTNVNLPFDTRTTRNPLAMDQISKDEFEDGLSNWASEGWEIDSTESHSGTHSVKTAKANSPEYLSSQTYEMSNAEGFTISFWYKYHGIHDKDFSLQFWNGSTYRDIFQLENATLPDTWHWYSIQTYDPRYCLEDFRLRFRVNSLGADQAFWLDDFSLSVPSRTRDYSGYDNHATIHDATWTSEGVVGGAYNFDGVNDFLRIPDDPSLGGDGSWTGISVEFWVKPAAELKGACIMAKKVANQTIGSYNVGFSSNDTMSANTLFWSVNNGTGWQNVSDGTTTVLNAASWHHIVCTYESGSGLSIYINGTLRASVVASGNISCSPGASIYGAPLFIGYDSDRENSHWFNGSLDEIRIYPRRLTSSQILQRFLETKNGQSNSSTIVSQETNAGDTWRCQVTPNDSFSDGGSSMYSTGNQYYWWEILGLIGLILAVTVTLTVFYFKKKHKLTTNTANMETQAGKQQNLARTQHMLQR
jgi:hypothetical protein